MDQEIKKNALQCHEILLATFVATIEILSISILYLSLLQIKSRLEIFF